MSSTGQNVVATLTPTSEPSAAPATSGRPKRSQIVETGEGDSSIYGFNTSDAWLAWYTGIVSQFESWIRAINNIPKPNPVWVETLNHGGETEWL